MMNDALTMKKNVPWLFFLSNASLTIGVNLTGTYLAFYMTDRMLMPAALMGIVLFVPRIVNMIGDLLAGVIVQKVCIKPGQYRFWLLYAPFVLSIGSILCFINPNIPMAGKAALVLVGCITSGLARSFITIAQNGMLSKAAGPDMENRITISAKTIQGQNVGLMIAAMATIPLVLAIDNLGVDGYTVVQILYSIVVLIGALSLYAGTKMYEVYDPNFKETSGASVGIFSMIFGTLKNSQLIIVIVCDLLRWMQWSFMMSMGMYYYTYLVGNAALFAVGMTVESLVGIVFAFIAEPIVRRIGKKNSAIVSGLIAGVSYVMLALFAGSNYVLYIVFASIAYAGTSLIYACGINLYLDCGEYQLYKTGKDNRTFGMSTYGLAINAAFAFASLIVAGILNASGYDAVLETVAKPQTIVYLIGGVAAAIQFITVILMMFYKISDEKAAEYAEANAASMSK